MSAEWGSAINEWREVLGPDSVLADADHLAPYLNNVSGWEGKVPAVVLPISTDQVQQIVEIAVRHKTPLYPISTGCNWGMGSKIPPQESVIVDLRGMNKIHEINVSLEYAVIEPGVTQGQLYDEIQRRKLPLVINVTGSGRNTSLLGNALERGVGYFESRADSLTGLQVVMGTGEVIETGFEHYPESKISHVARHGVGPALDGLFSQSNFGIVTRAGFRLMRLPEVQGALVAGVDHDEELPELVDRLAELQRKGVIQTVIHVGSGSRAAITMSPLVYQSLAKTGGNVDHQSRVAETQRIIEAEGFKSWGAVTGIHGRPNMVRAMQKEIRRALKGVSSIQFLTVKKIRWIKKFLHLTSFHARSRDKSHILSAIEPLFGFALGCPTSVALHSVYWPHEEVMYKDPVQPDETKSGLLYVLPFLPCSGGDVRVAMEEIHNFFGRYGFEPYVTFNLMEGRCIEGVINLAYPRDDKKREEEARACIDGITKRFCEIGYIPYRVGIQSYGAVQQDNSFWTKARELKAVMDPEGIIAPGRYVPID